MGRQDWTMRTRRIIELTMKQPSEILHLVNVKLRSSRLRLRVGMLPGMDQACGVLIWDRSSLPGVLRQYIMCVLWSLLHCQTAVLMLNLLIAEKTGDHITCFFSN